MANKYANLVGTNKIKDEYTKINTGFDGVETDIDALNDRVDALDSRVDTIITTPISGEAATQEIVDARVSAVKSKTFATLDARFEETEQDIATHMAKKATETEYGHVRLADLPAGSSQGGKRVARFTIGTTQNGWTAGEVDYLCDGTDDQEEIIQALNGLPETGGEVVILDGTYNITASINIPKDNVSLRGNGNATILNRMYDSTDTESGSTARGLITLNEKSGCKIQGLQIDGNNATYTASYNSGICLYGSLYNTVTGNTCIYNNYGIYLYGSGISTITGNTCYNNSNGICLYGSLYNTVTGNTCIRGMGTPEDYTTNQYTILLSGTGNDYNLISSNNCMGKAVVVEGGTGNSAWGNKFDATDDLP